MAWVHKQVLAIAVASALSCGLAHALGLGEITLQSQLNQPLVAEIEVLKGHDLVANELITTLASPEAFNKAGIDRPHVLTDLTFTPVFQPNGKSVIRVTSTQPMREPYLNLLLNVLWPNGRLQREYTLLLDPPLYTAHSVIPSAVQAAVTAATPAARSQPASAPAPQQATAASGAVEDNHYTTSTNDNLWDIANRTRAGGSVHQAMLAIQTLNPDAFIEGNINRMKSGQVLRLPTAQQINSRTHSTALAQVNAQNAAWRDARHLAAGTRQLDASKRSSAAPVPATLEQRDNLKLVAIGSDKAGAGRDTGSAGNAARLNQLAVTQEMLDATNRENDELKSRIADLQRQLDKLQRLIELKNDQMAALQAYLAAQDPAPAITADVAEATAGPSAQD